MTLPSGIPDAAERQAFQEQRGSDQDGLVSIGGRHGRGGPRTLPQLADPTGPAFSSRVRQGFGRSAASYEAQARLQQGVAWRLGRLCRDLPLPAGPCADLGAGSGLLSRALLAQRPSLAKPPLQLDLCPELLARNPLAGPTTAPWDLNRGMPPQLRHAGLLLSSFALQWLDDPLAQLAHWAGSPPAAGWPWRCRWPAASTPGRRQPALHPCPAPPCPCPRRTG